MISPLRCEKRVGNIRCIHHTDEGESSFAGFRSFGFASRVYRLPSHATGVLYINCARSREATNLYIKMLLKKKSANTKIKDPNTNRTRIYNHLNIIRLLNIIFKMGKYRKNKSEGTISDKLSWEYILSSKFKIVFVFFLDLRQYNRHHF